MHEYYPDVNSDLEKMLEDLETIANLTRESQETAHYMKDSVVSAQKSSPPGNMQFGAMKSFP